MKTIRLISLTLDHFKGVKKLHFEPAGEDAAIYGTNATGKTTMYDAFLWLLFDKDSSGNKEFDKKTRDENGEPIPMINHSVTGVFNIDSRPVTLKKVFSEKWTKKRGSSHAEFDGHTTDYFVDEVPAKLKEYKEKVAQIADEDLFRLLTSTTYFNEQLHWQKQRETLLAICGDVDDDEVIAANPELAELTTILNGHSLDDHKKVIASRRQEINKRLSEIPVRIDQIKESMPGGPKTDAQAPIKKITELQKQASDKRSELTRIESGGQVAEWNKELAGFETEMIKMRSRHQEAVDSLVKGKRAEAEKIRAEKETVESAIKKAQAVIDDAVTTIDDLSDKTEKLRAEWREINGRQLEQVGGDDICPTCGQMLPNEQVAAAREKATSNFNRKKAEDLAENVRAGKANKAKIDDLQAVIDGKEKEQAEATEKLNNLSASLIDVESEIQRITADAPTVEELDEYKDLRGQIMAIEAKIEGAQEGNSGSVENLKTEIDAINDQIEEQQKIVANVEYRQKLEDQAAELKAEEKMLAAEFEKLEHHLFLCEQFIRDKVSRLDERINSRFSLVRFRLFREQLNGGL